MKKFKLFALTALFCAIGTNAFADDPLYAYDKANKVRYTYVIDGDANGSAADKRAAATVYGVQESQASITIPKEFQTEDENGIIMYFKVVAFGENWDNKKSDEAKTKSVIVKDAVTSLTIDATNMTNLNNMASNLTKLASLTISSTATTHTSSTLLGTFTAAVKKSLTTLDLSGCTKMVTIADNAFTVSDKVFDKLTTVTLPAALTSIGKNAFKGFKGTSITLPETLESIGSLAFNRSALTKIDIPEKVATLGAGAFATSQIAEVTGMEGLTALPKNAFKSCAKLTAISLPEDIVEIGEAALGDCKLLASIEILGEVTTIDANAFQNDVALESIDLSGTVITTINGNTNAQFLGCTALKEIKLPETLTSIGAQAFGDCVIEDLDLSETGITILNAIFRHGDGTYPDEETPYASLKSIKLPETLTKIYDYSALKNGVFSYCTGLTTIDLPTSLTEDIPAYAFYYAKGLKTVNYKPETSGSSKKFDDNAFLGCTPRVKINTNSFYFADNNIADPITEVPLNAYYIEPGDLTVTPVKDNGTSGLFFGKYCPKLNVEISVEDANAAGVKFYSVYNDNDIAYFQALRPRSQMYVIPAGYHVIVKATSADAIPFAISTAGTNSVQEDWILNINNDKDVTLEEYQTTVCDNAYGVSWIFNDDSKTMPANGYKYLYALTNSKNNGGFGFTFYGGTTLKEGAFFIPFTTAPAAGRLNMVWLDENGNVENDATAINAIESDENANAEIYNLQGARVNGTQKGVYIKNGKKFIVK